MFASKINTYIWKDDKYNKIENILEHNNFTLFQLPWNNFTLYKNDQNHFTWNGFKTFSKYLTDFIKKIISKKYNNIENLSILILSDSTIDYWNYEPDNIKKANNYIKEELKPFNITIDAVSGSGFCAMKNDRKDRKDFVYRLHKIVKNNKKYDLIIVIGGWNDYNYSLEEINSSIEQCSKIISNLLKKYNN